MFLSLLFREFLNPHYILALKIPTLLYTSLLYRCQLTSNTGTVNVLQFVQCVPYCFRATQQQSKRMLLRHSMRERK